MQDMHGFNKAEIKIFKKLSTPRKIQDFLEKIPIRGEGGDSCCSPKMVLKKRRAHCLEGAIFAAAALRLHGFPPLVVDLIATKKDYDHVIAPFKINGYWGAISHTNYPVLRYRDPIYKNIRELVLSYFNEYFLDSGKKTLRRYTRPVNLSRFDHKNWTVSDENLWFIDEYLDTVPYRNILTPKMRASLRKASPIEIKMGKLRQWK